MSGVYTTDNSWMEEVDFSDEEQRCKALDARDAESFNGMLGIRFAEQSSDRTVAELDIHPRLFQPFGFLHGLSLIHISLRCGGRGGWHGRPPRFNERYRGP